MSTTSIVAIVLTAMYMMTQGTFINICARLSVAVYFEAFTALAPVATINVLTDMLAVSVVVFTLVYVFTNFVFHKAKTPRANAIISSNKVDTLVTAASIVYVTFVVISAYCSTIQTVAFTTRTLKSSVSISASCSTFVAINLI